MLGRQGVPHQAFHYSQRQSVRTARRLTTNAARAEEEEQGRERRPRPATRRGGGQERGPPLKKNPENEQDSLHQAPTPQIMTKKTRAATKTRRPAQGGGTWECVCVCPGKARRPSRRSARACQAAAGQSEPGSPDNRRTKRPRPLQVPPRAGVPAPARPVRRIMRGAASQRPGPGGLAAQPAARGRLPGKPAA